MGWPPWVKELLNQMTLEVTSNLSQSVILWFATQLKKILWCLTHFLLDLFFHYVHVLVLHFILTESDRYLLNFVVWVFFFFLLAFLHALRICIWNCFTCILNILQNIEIAFENVKFSVHNKVRQFGTFENNNWFLLLQATSILQSSFNISASGQGIKVYDKWSL